MTKFESIGKNPTFRDFVSLPLKLFSNIGLKFFSWDDNTMMTTREKVLLAVLFTNCFINCLALCVFPIFTVFDILELSEWLLLLMIASNGFLKTLSVILGREALNKILKELEIVFRESDFNLSEGLAFIRYYMKTMYRTQLYVTWLFNALPMLQTGAEYLETKEFKGRMPFITYYPFDVTHGINYLAALFSQNIASFTVICCFVAPDMLLICTIYAVILQFQNLSHRIEHFESKNYEQDMKYLSDILEKHSLLNILAQDVNSVFSVSILLNYINNIIIMMLIGLQVVFSSELVDCIKYFILCFIYTMEIYYVCKFGDLLLENSALVGEKFADQKWYMADNRYQRMLPLAIARSQKPAHLTAYKFFIISMESFSNLITTSYRIFTLLKTRLEETDL